MYLLEILFHKFSLATKLEVLLIPESQTPLRQGTQVKFFMSEIN